MRAFNTDLASVADQLAGERGELALALKNLAVALGEVASFVKENRANLTTDIAGLADITGVLAKQKDALAEVLDAGPVALSNLQNAYNPASGTLDTRDNAEQLDDPGALPLLAPDVARAAAAGLRPDRQGAEEQAAAGAGRAACRATAAVAPTSRSAASSGGRSERRPADRAAWAPG